MSTNMVGIIYFESIVIISIFLLIEFLFIKRLNYTLLKNKKELLLLCLFCLVPLICLSLPKFIIFNNKSLLNIKIIKDQHLIQKFRNFIAAIHIFFICTFIQVYIFSNSEKANVYTSKSNVKNNLSSLKFITKMVIFGKNKQLNEFLILFYVTILFLKISLSKYNLSPTLDFIFVAILGSILTIFTSLNIVEGYSQYNYEKEWSTTIKPQIYKYYFLLLIDLFTKINDPFLPINKPLLKKYTQIKHQISEKLISILMKETDCKKQCLLLLKELEIYISMNHETQKFVAICSEFDYNKIIEHYKDFNTLKLKLNSLQNLTNNYSVAYKENLFLVKLEFSISNLCLKFENVDNLELNNDNIQNLLIEELNIIKDIFEFYSHIH